MPTKLCCVLSRIQVHFSPSLFVANTMSCDASSEPSPARDEFWCAKAIELGLWRNVKAYLTIFICRFSLVWSLILSLSLFLPLTLSFTPTRIHVHMQTHPHFAPPLGCICKHIVIYIYIIHIYLYMNVYF